MQFRLWRDICRPSRNLRRNQPSSTATAVTGSTDDAPILGFLRANLRHAALAFVAIQLAGCSSPEQRAQNYYEHGKELLAAHDNQRAEIEFRNAVKYNPKLLPAWRSLADVEEQMHNWKVLVPALRNILELEPDDIATRIKLGRLLLVGGAFDDALKLVNDAKAADTSKCRPFGAEGCNTFQA